MKKTRKIDDKNRLVIPKIMLDGIEVNQGDLVNIYYDDKQIIITNPKNENKRIKTKKEIEEKLHNLNELIKVGFEDERLNGSIDMLEWMLSSERNVSDYLNNYDDEVEEENISFNEEAN